jgi:glutathione S-transferase
VGLYDSSHPGVKAMKGLHLFHFAISNCSQRVRFALEEKRLDWESHHLNLPANEHVTEEYQSLNPNGVVPTLVHDGQVVIESNDILGYLDEHFPEPPLRPSDAGQRTRMEERIALASGAQGTIKTLSHERIFRPFRKIGPEELALYDAKAADRELVAFLHDFAENGEAWQARVKAAEADIEQRLDALEEALGQDPWLSGDAFGLADISWSVNSNRLTLARLPLERWPDLQAWHEKVTARPAFDRAVVRWRPDA